MRSAIVMDGAYGTEIYATLRRMNMPVPAVLDEIAVTAPKLLFALHQNYISAGVDIIKTLTFRSNAAVLTSMGYPPGSVHKFINAACQIANAANQASGKRCLIAGSVGPAGPDADYLSYRGQVTALLAGSVDCILLETFVTPTLAKVALHGVQEAFEMAGSRRPVCLSVTPIAPHFDPERIAELCVDYGVQGLLVNCVEPREAFSAAVELHSYKVVGVGLSPSAGLPQLRGTEEVYTMTPSAFARSIFRLSDEMDFEPAVIGGCCGIGPSHMAAVFKSLKAVRK